MGDPYSGVIGLAYWESVAFTTCTSWTCTLECQTAETTAKSTSTTGRTRAAGLKGGSATVTCVGSGDLIIEKGATGTLELLRDGTNASKGYTGEAVCTGTETTTGKDNVERTVYSFVWDGEVSGTVTEGT